MESSSDNEIQNILESHFKDDKKSFDRINELMLINGEHMSHFRKDATEIKIMLEKQNEVFAEHRKSLATHMQRVEPMISAYEVDTKFNQILGIRTKKWGIRIGLFASAIGSWYVIKAFIIEQLK